MIQSDFLHYCVEVGVVKELKLLHTHCLIVCDLKPNLPNHAYWNTEYAIVDDIMCLQLLPSWSCYSTSTTLFLDHSPTTLNCKSSCAPTTLNCESSCAPTTLNCESSCASQVRDNWPIYANNSIPYNNINKSLTLYKPLMLVFATTCFSRCHWQYLKIPIQNSVE